MRKVAVVVDSIACLTKGQVEEHGITVMPLNFYHGGKLYRDWVDVTPSEAYELFLQDPESFKTSSISPGDVIETYRKVSEQAEGILCITVSSRLSAVYNAALDAREMVKEELPGVSIEVLDSLNCTAAEGFIALAAARAATEGGSLAEVTAAARDMMKRVRFLVFLDTIRHVYRSGRIPKVASQVGSALNVKPILTMSPPGVLRFLGVARSRKSGVERLLKTMRRELGTGPAHIAVMHAYAPEEAEELRERIASEFCCAELWVTEFSPLMGYSCGTGTLGVAFYHEG
ncbi:MAG TPA: DegV family protein [Dehalococcoidales bacterium]|nr:DegV family protein [Dehalococcoidales bacterium]